MFFSMAVFQDSDLVKGQVIKSNARIKPAVYQLASEGTDTGQAAITIKGDNIVVDFQGATLQGTSPTVEPDMRVGLALSVQGDSVTIKNLKIQGYKIGLWASKCKGLKIIDCDFSYNWKQRLFSDSEKEDTADWMSFHENDNHEWARYGAGAYLTDCRDFEVKNLRVTGGQCGLMLNKSSGGTVWNCDLSFNSAVGIGLYRSSSNKLMHNKADWCVRGYSHGVYNRGQDSAGIVMFEQCNNNTVAYNSVTHGGDGLFLWAGQDTMDNGGGGCNDNLVFGNDFSHSPANGIEATFSRNKFVNNLLLDCWHGVWGGYSYDTLVLGNRFAYNGESIAIEHGQYNRIEGNVFVADTVGTMLWQNSGDPDPNWGYPKFRDTRNVGTQVLLNVFDGISEAAIEATRGDKLVASNNRVTNAKTALRLAGPFKSCGFSDNILQGDIEGGEFAGNNKTVSEKSNPPAPWKTRGGNSLVANEPRDIAYLEAFQSPWNPWPSKGPVVPEQLSAIAGAQQSIADQVKSLAPEPLEGGNDPMIPGGTPRGRKYIIIDEWGPYDFQRPILVPAGPPDGKNVQPFRFLGPKGSALTKVTRGTRLVKVGDKEIGNYDDVRKLQIPTNTDLLIWVDPNLADLEYTLEFIGEETADYRGIKSPAGTPVPVSHRRTTVPVAWKASFYQWEPKTQDPRTNVAAFDSLTDGDPTAKWQTNELSFATGGSPFNGVPDNNFATVAEGSFVAGPGKFELSVTADDGVRVWVDNVLLIDEWHYQAPTRFTRELELKPGRHTIRVRHFEIDGYTALKVGLKPKR